MRENRVWQEALQHYAHELREALLRWQPEPGNREALALQATRALGYLLLFEQPIPEDAAPLPLELVYTAVEAAERLFIAYRQAAERIASEWEEADDELLRRERLLERLQDRMDAQAIFAGVAEALDGAVDRGELDVDEYAALIDRLAVGLKAYEEQLRAEEELLATVSDAPLLAQWEAVLPEPLRGLWWLPRQLGRTAERLVNALEDTAAALADPILADQIVSLGTLAPTPSGPPIVGFPGQLVTVSLAAQAGQSVDLKWYSPEKRYLAWGRLSYPARDTQSVRVHYYRLQDGAPARELAGKRAILAGVSADIREPAVAEFPISKLRQALARRRERVLDLRLESPEAAAWEPDRDSWNRVKRTLGEPEIPDQVD